MKKQSINSSSSGYESSTALSEVSGSDAITLRVMDTNVMVGGLRNGGVKATLNFNVGKENPLQIQLF